MHQRLPREQQQPAVFPAQAGRGRLGERIESSWFNTGVGYGAFDDSTTNSGIGYEYAQRLAAGQSAAEALYNAKSSMSPNLTLA